MMYKYTIFGLNVESKIELGHYPQTQFKGKTRVTIKKGKLTRPEDDLPKTVYKPYSVFNNDIYFLDVGGIAKFSITQSEIIIDKYKSSNWQDVFAFLFDGVFTVMLLKNDVFVFHAMAIKIKKQTIMFCGASGIGKSTLAVFLASKMDAKIIEDDKCLLVLNKKTGKIQIKNQYPFVEVWKPQVGFAHRIKGLKPISKVRKNIKKFRYNIQDHIPKRALNVDRIVLMNMTRHEDDIIYEEVTGIRKVNVVKNYSHMHYIVPALGKNKEHFKAIAEVVQGLPVHSVDKSRLTSLEDFLTFIENEIIT